MGRSAKLCIVLAAAQYLDIVVTSVLHVFFHSRIAKPELVLKLSLYLYSTSLPFYVLDKALIAARSHAVLTWKIWTVEALNIATILFGATGRENHPDEWLTIYAIGFGVNVCAFGLISSWMLSRLVANPSDEHVLNTNYLRIYRNISFSVVVLDLLSDTPVCFSNVKTEIYVNNWVYTANTVANVLAIARGIYILLRANELAKNAITTTHPLDPLHEGPGCGVLRESSGVSLPAVPA